jgi:hypothetical protein
VIHYNVWFSFKDGISEPDGLGRVRRFLGDLQRRGQIAEFRLMRNTREGDKTNLGPLQAQISFVDSAQFGAPFAEVAATGVHAGQHGFMIEHVNMLGVEVFEDLVP